MQTSTEMSSLRGKAIHLLTLRGWWLWEERPLQKGTLTLWFKKPLPDADTDPLPAPTRVDVERNIHILRPVCGTLRTNRT